MKHGEGKWCFCLGCCRSILACLTFVMHLPLQSEVDHVNLLFNRNVKYREQLSKASATFPYMGMDFKHIKSISRRKNTKTKMHLNFRQCFKHLKKFYIHEKLAPFNRICMSAFFLFSSLMFGFHFVIFFQNTC